MPEGSIKLIVTATNTLFPLLFHCGAELKHLYRLVPLLVAVTGRVWASRPVKCELSENEGVIVSLREEQKTEKRSQNVWFSDSEPLRDVVRESPWALADGKGPFAVMVPVIDGRHAAAGGNYLETSGDIFIPAAEGFTDQILGHVLGVKNLGIRRTERYLPVGTVLTAVGELQEVREDQSSSMKGTFRSHDKVLVLKAPQGGPFILSKLPLPDLIASAEATSVICGKIAVVFTTAGVCMLGISLIQSYLRRKRELYWERLAREARARRAGTAAATSRGGVSRGDGAGGADVNGEDGSDNELDRRGLCIICLEKDCDMVFPNCGHMCVCGNCTSSGRLAQCPICRTHGRPIRVFIT